MSTVTSARLAEIESLEAQLAALKAAEREEREALAKSVVPVYQYEIRPAEDPSQVHEKIMDDSIVVFILKGTCLNQDEIDAVGGKTHTGQMKYLFNTLSGKIIMGYGGGSVFIRDGRFMSRGEVDDSEQAFAEISEFLARHPYGGEITHLIEAHQARRNPAPQV